MIVDSVRYCRSGVPVICNAKTQSEYSAWETHGVPHRHQKRTFIARYSTPPRSSTRHLVFMADGQSNGNDWDFQFDGSADRSSVSGRVEDFRDHFSRYDRSRNIQELSYNLPGFLLNGQLNGFNSANTFIAASWDARFHYASSSDTLNRVANAHYDWLRGKFNANTLDVIILAGHSRGGAMVTVLAKKFRQAYPDIPVLVYTLEGVPSRKRSVPPLSSTEVSNPIRVPVPLNPNILVRAGYGYHFDFASFYGNTNQLRAVNVLTGRSFLPLDVNRVRPMAHSNPVNGVESQFFDWGWLQQEWFNRGHNSFNNEWATDYILNDLQNNVPDFIAERERLRPPVARCLATPPYAQGNYANVQFNNNGSYSSNGASIISYNWQFYRPGGAYAYSVSGPGPHNFGVYSNGAARAKLTVTNSEGVSASTNCSFTLLGGCAGSPNAILCEAPFE